jgi:hypothetical protein
MLFCGETEPGLTADKTKFKYRKGGVSERPFDSLYAPVSFHTRPILFASAAAF